MIHISLFQTLFHNSLNLCFDGFIFEEGKPFVYLENNGNKEAVFIEIGIADDFNTEVLSGLQEGDMIYASY